MIEQKINKQNIDMSEVNKRVKVLLEQMTLQEKLGQMSQISGGLGNRDNLKEAIRKGKVGSVLNEVGADSVNELQRIAIEESRLGIPLIFGRDVIHGFQTILPIPIGLASTWNPALVKSGARISAVEAASEGIQWTFAPMIDICRDPRWGRIAESFGEDPHLTSVLGNAMIEGFQSDDLSRYDSIAACAKHFAAYGYSEAGKDYASVDVSESELRNVILPPFKASVDAGVATFMTAFCDINGIPASANESLLKDILRNEWKFQGFVVSDWDSVIQLITHGLSENGKEAALSALRAGVDMEMVSQTYFRNLESLINESKIDIEDINQCVSNILRVKFQLGLFDQPFTDPAQFPSKGNEEHLQIAKEAAIESCVLLKNDYNKLPLDINSIHDLAIIGPLAHEPAEQLGTWVFDGVSEWSQTPLMAIKNEVGDRVNVHYAKGFDYSRSKDRSGFEEALEAGKKSDTIIMFMGEEAILSGEAHCRAEIDLPGLQNELLEELSKLGKSTVLVILAGRPLTIQKTRDYANAVLYAWHPGTMGGPAISDIVFGKVSPSGKLPVSFPKLVGQIPVYYAQKNTGRPTKEEHITFIDDIPVRAAQTSIGNTSFHLDAGIDPLYPFGYGLSYGKFHYFDIWLSDDHIRPGDTFEIHAEVSNHGKYSAKEVVQLYVRDLFGSITRPVKELKGFQSVYLKPEESKMISFTLHTDDLGFYNRAHKKVTEPGRFDVWIGGDSNAELKTSFEIIE